MLPPLSRRTFFGAAALSRLALAQDPKFSSDVKVVNVLASVRNKQGKVVKGLPQGEFTLEEDGRPQTIRYFSAQHDLALTLGLLVDTSMSMRRVLEVARGASYEFLSHVMREDRDKAFVIHFDREVELAQDLTNSRKDLEAALQDLKVAEGGMRRQQRGGNGGGSYPDPNQYPQGGGGQYPGGRNPQGGGYPGGGYPGGGGIGWPTGRRTPQGGNRYPQDPNQYPPGDDPRQQQGAGGTTLYDAVLLGAEDMMAKQQGRKALIVLSDGSDRGSRVSLARAIEAAQRSETLVYTIHIADNSVGSTLTGNRRLPLPSGRSNGKETLKRLSLETGGGYQEGAVKDAALRAAFSQIDEELRNQYNIGYTPDKEGRAGEFHTIKLVTRDRSNTVQCRSGYFTRD
jgi:Mg-chelatase subunit ChlD